ncbi:MAG: tRNA N6-adenosine threonylcarbamoyltransferase [Ignavibacteria bacterium]|nr:tRNA N6-adenosine threonylcarbamoyltransferase [Ignavibacteria bacterium]
MITLAIETSCDETSAAVLNKDKVLSNIILSQQDHSKFGGIVPELASRSHLESIVSVTRTALLNAGINLKDINLISATSEPGLIGALLVGLNFAKSLAASLNIPFIPVNHIRSHLYSNFLCNQKAIYPFIGLIVSGGHTMLVLVEDFNMHTVLGNTIDDAAGEAFDKAAKLLGLGYPGGAQIDNSAKSGNENFIRFPKAKIKNSKYDFSFSGIKTSLLYYLRDVSENEKSRADFVNDVCSSFQKTVTDDLFEKTVSACSEFNVKKISVSGGVSANSEMRKKFNQLKSRNFEVYFPEIQYATDNAAMIGLCGYLSYISADDKTFFKSASLLTPAKARLDYEKF